MRHLQDAFVDGKQHNLGRPVGGVAQLQRLAGLDQIGRVNGDLGGATGAAQRERRDAVAQWAHKHVV